MSNLIDLACFYTGLVAEQRCNKYEPILTIQYLERLDCMVGDTGSDIRVGRTLAIEPVLCSVAF